MKRILLTGDDGYQSIGTRLVIRALQRKYDLTVVATKSQMSGVGGHVNLKNGAAYAKTHIDGVPAYCVDGYPADAMEFVAGYLPEFDYIISGLNLGANLGPGIPSGTVAAAVHGVALHNALKAIILSWHVHPKHYLRSHNAEEALDDYMQYPLQPLKNILSILLQHDLWGADIVNVNFPEHDTRRARMTKILDNLQTFYAYPGEHNEQTNHFSYSARFSDTLKNHDAYDELGALSRGYIAITPWGKNMFDEKVFRAYGGKDLAL